MIHTIEHYGDFPQYNDETDTLSFSRIYGAGSNMMYLLLLLMYLKLKNFYPKKIIANLKFYHDINLYDKIFEINLDNLNKWKEFDSNQVTNFVYKNGLNLYGLGTSRDSMDFNLISCILNVYFNFKQNIFNEAQSFINDTKINIEDDTFIWWRRSDKPTEITWYSNEHKYPSVDQIIPLLKSSGNKFLQTDDDNIKNEVLNLNIENLKLLNYLPTCNNNEGFHNIIKHTDPNNFLNKYSCTVEHHLIKFFSLILAASRFKYFIGYPGTISYIVAILRKNFDNFVFFKNSLEFY